MERIRLIHDVGSPLTRRKRSAEEGSCEGSMKGDRAKLRSPIASVFADHISPDIATIVTHRHPLSTRLSLSGIALLLCVSLLEEPVGCAVTRTILHGRRRKGSGRPRPSRGAGHRVAEKRSRI